MLDKRGFLQGGFAYSTSDVDHKRKASVWSQHKPVCFRVYNLQFIHNNVEIYADALYVYQIGCKSDIVVLLEITFRLRTKRKSESLYQLILVQEPFFNQEAWCEQNSAIFSIYETHSKVGLVKNPPKIHLNQTRRLAYCVWTRNPMCDIEWQDIETHFKGGPSSQQSP